MPTRQQLETQYIQDKAFWGSIGGRWRGLAGGILVGGLLGVAIGLVAATGFSAITGIAVAELGKASLLGLVGFFGASGMLVGANLWSGAGQVAGAVASGLVAQKELDGKTSEALQQEVALSPENAQNISSAKLLPNV